MNHIKEMSFNIQCWENKSKLHIYPDVKRYPFLDFIDKLVVVLLILVMKSLPTFAGVQGDAELLKTVALKHKTNLESILTWKGEAFEERTSTIGDSYEYMLKNKCTFAYDQLQQAVRWNREPQEIRFLKNGKPQYSMNSNFNSAMIKGQTSYDYKGSGLDPNGNVTYHLVIGEPERVEKKGNHGLNPKYFFKNCRSIPLYDKLMHLYNNANNPELIETYVKKEGNHVIITSDTTVNGQPISEKFVFDLSAGGNLIDYYNKGPTYENHREYEYEDNSGVWVLKSFKKVNKTHKTNGEILKSTRIINWSNSVVNVPLKEDEFTMEKLGVKQGARVSDHRIGKGYIYEGTLIEPPPLPKTLIKEKLPELKELGVNLSAVDVNDKSILVCFFDIEQRPSRNCILQLSKRAQELKEKDVIVVAVQASKIEQEKLDEWIKENDITFLVGMIESNLEKVQLAWGVKSLPWLILTDKNHIVTAEGFSLDELNEEITEAENTKR